MQAKKRPVIIDFFDVTDNTFLDETPLKDWVASFGDSFQEKFKLDYDPFEIKVKTLEGTSYDVTSDDVIIRGVMGEYYPCKKNIFNETYEIIL